MKNKGELAVFLSAVLWGCIGISVRNLERLGVGSLGIVFLRCFSTVIILTVLLLIRFHADLKIHRRDLPLLAGNGILSVLMFTYCYYTTIALSTLSVAAVLMYTAPIFVMIISVLFFKEKLTVNKVIAVIISFVGCAFVSGIVGTAIKISPTALCFGLLTGFGYSLYTIFSSRLIIRGNSTLTVIYYTFLFALAGSVVLLLLRRETAIFTYPAEAWLWAFLMGIFNTILPYLLYTYGLKSMEPTKAPIIATVEPAFATVLGFFAYGEKLTIFGVIGIVLVLGSVVIVNLKSKKKAT
ncbi:MAG: EamA family transporter [Clostridia bacterium]|nr:EamA family transporter [Clostridia bacterium]